MSERTGKLVIPVNDSDWQDAEVELSDPSDGEEKTFKTLAHKSGDFVVTASMYEFLISRNLALKELAERIEKIESKLEEKR